MSNILKIISSAPLSAKFGMLVVLIYSIVAIFAPFIAPYGEREILGRAFELWSDKYLLGTDNLGRDMLSRMIFGARNTIGLALSITILAFLLGSLTGMIAAALGGWVDQILSRIVDVLMSIPSLIFALLILSIFGTSVSYLIATITVIEATRVFRLARATAMNVVVMDYVEVARVRGENSTGSSAKKYYQISQHHCSQNSGCVFASFFFSFPHSVFWDSVFSRPQRIGVQWFGTMHH